MPRMAQPGEYVVWRGKNFIAHAAPSFVLRWQGRTYYVEWHPYCGPARLRKDGEPFKRQPSQRSPFWKAVGEWEAAGLKVDDQGNAILEPRNA